MIKLICVNICKGVLLIVVFVGIEVVILGMADDPVTYDFNKISR